MCLAILNGDSNAILDHIDLRNHNFTSSVDEVIQKIETLTEQCHKICKKIVQIRNQMDYITRQADSLQNVMPSEKKNLNSEIQQLGDTKISVQLKEMEYDELLQRRNKLRAETIQLTQELLNSPLENEERKADLEKIRLLKNKVATQFLEFHEIQMTKKRYSMEIEEYGQQVKQIDEDLKYINQQSNSLKELIEKEKWKCDSLKSAGVKVSDIELITSCAQKSTPAQMEVRYKGTLERSKQLKDSKKALQQRVLDAKNQLTRYDEEIREKEYGSK